MEEQAEPRKKSSWPWIVLVVLIVLLLGCVLCAIAGAVGFLVARTATEGAAPAPQSMPFQTPERVFPMPGITPRAPETIMGMGAAITAITPDSPADGVDLRVGDVVYQINGQTLTADMGLAARIGEYQPGDSIVLSVLRTGQSLDIRVELGRNPNRAGETPWLGVEYRDVPLMPMMMPERMVPSGS